MTSLQETISRVRPVSVTVRSLATQRLNSLAMPRRALGRLLELAETLAAICGTADIDRTLDPCLKRRVNLVMAADHGVAVEGVSQYPQAVTRAMVETILSGRASINALATTANSSVVVVDMGVIGAKSWTARDGFLDRRIADGTDNMAVGPAMTRQQAVQSIEAGIEVAASVDADVVGLGEMGIANTTAATAIGCVLLGVDPMGATGSGTGLSSEAVKHKASVIRRAIEINGPDPNDGIDVLRTVGGFEIGGLVGAILGTAAFGKPIIIDGLISTSAVLIAHSLCPHVADWLIASHLSAEPLHQQMLNHLKIQAYLDLEMRLGEGTGAALMLPMLDAAAALLKEVATLEEVLK
ncbi:MAG: nicotinate-nucleotide--dimethylbenzimidazole phosphoribosyltransferase [Pirellulales bacterium]|nr:nicotinate-nucleotide--dimethylbenzimidazole phosphoribosyltransferase [Pirellulales bacterium]